MKEQQLTFNSNQISTSDLKSISDDIEPKLCLQFMRTQQYYRIHKFKKQRDNVFRIMLMLAEDNILFKQETMNWKAFDFKYEQKSEDLIYLSVSYGSFTIPIKILVKYNDQYPKDSPIISFGSFGEVYDSDYYYFTNKGISNKKIVSKQIKHSLRKIKRFQNQLKQKQKQLKKSQHFFSSIYRFYGTKQMQQLSAKIQLEIKKFHKQLFQFIKEFAIAKICSSLKIGPRIHNEYYDIIIYNDTFAFNMENCQTKITNYQQLQKDITDSLTILHSLSIIHSDIKPNNIAYSYTFKKYVLLDFGLSTIIKQPVGNLTIVDKFIGTYFYCSEEMKKLLTKQKPTLINLYKNDWNCFNNTLLQLKKIINQHEDQYEQENLTRSENNKTRVRHQIQLRTRQQLRYIEWPNYNNVPINSQLIKYPHFSQNVKINHNIIAASIVNFASNCNSNNFITPDIVYFSKNQLMASLISLLDLYKKQKQENIPEEYLFFDKLIHFFEIKQPLQAFSKFQIFLSQTNCQSFKFSSNSFKQFLNQIISELKNCYPRCLPQILLLLLEKSLLFVYENQTNDLKELVVYRCIQMLFHKSDMRYFLPDLKILINMIKDPLQKIDLFVCLSFFTQISKQQKQQMQRQLFQEQNINSQKKYWMQQNMIRLIKQLLTQLEMPIIQMNILKFKDLIQQLFFIPLYVSKLKLTFTLCYERAKKLFAIDRKFMQNLQNSLRNIRENNTLWNHIHFDQRTQGQYLCLQQNLTFDYYCQKFEFLLFTNHLTWDLQNRIRDTITYEIAYCIQNWNKFKFYHFTFYVLILFPIDRFLQLTEMNKQLRFQIFSQIYQLEEIFQTIAPLFIQYYRSQKYQKKILKKPIYLSHKVYSRNYFESLVIMYQIRQQLISLNRKEINTSYIDNIINYIQDKQSQKNAYFMYYFQLYKMSRIKNDIIYTLNILKNFQQSPQNGLNLALSIRFQNNYLLFKLSNYKQKQQFHEEQYNRFIIQQLNSLKQSPKQYYILRNLQQSKQIFSFCIQLNEPQIFFEWFCLFFSSASLDIQTWSDFFIIFEFLGKANSYFIKKLLEIVQKYSPLHSSLKKQNENFSSSVLLFIVMLHLFFENKMISYGEKQFRTQPKIMKNYIHKAAIIFELVCLYHPIYQMKRMYLSIFYKFIDNFRNVIFPRQYKNKQRKQIYFKRQYLKQICKNRSGHLTVFERFLNARMNIIKRRQNYKQYSLHYRISKKIQNYKRKIKERF